MVGTEKRARSNLKKKDTYLASPSTKRQRIQSTVDINANDDESKDNPKAFIYNTRNKAKITVESTACISLLDSSDEDDDTPTKPTANPKFQTKKWIFKGQHRQRQKVITIDPKAINKLKKGQELNDDIIEFGLYYSYNLWNDQFKKQCYLLPVSFWNYLNNYDNGLIKAQKCYKKIGNDILKRKYIIFPKGSHNHWELIIICNPNIYQSNHAYNAPCIIILDSTNKGELFHKKDFKVIRDWLNYISFSNKYNGGTCKGYCPELPQQRNGTDCGIFCIKNMIKFGEDEGFTDTTSKSALQNSKWYTIGDGESYRVDLAHIINNL